MTRVGTIDIAQLREIIREEVKAAIIADREEQVAIAWKWANEENIRINKKLREALEYE